MDCPNCGFDNRVDARYCGMCGSRVAHGCGVCGFANPTAYRFCIQCGAPLEAPSAETRSRARHEAQLASPPTPEPTPPVTPPAQLEGERRVASIILADVQGSTDLLERVGSETWVEMMNRVFQLLEAEIYRFGGTVDQFRGDGLVAFFGTDVAHEDDPERAVLAALAMQRAVAGYAHDLATQEGIQLSLRVGVNTGEVIVASVGDDRTYSENTAMGQAIALAARMEEAAEPGTVLVSENTQRLAPNQFEWLALGEIQVKGIHQPVGVFRPLSSSVQTDLGEFVSLSSPLVGRERAREAVMTCIEDLMAGRGGIVMLTGERGIGKSVLLRELRRSLARREALLTEAQGDGFHDGAAGLSRRPGPAGARRPRELRARARSYDQTEPYAMWHDLLHTWLGTTSEEPKETTRDRLRAKAQALWGDAAPGHVVDLAWFLGLPLEPAEAAQLQHADAEGSRQDIFLAVRSWLEQLAQQGPAIITFSDMHWADATSLELLKYCLPLCDYLDLLWLFVFRSDRQSSAWEFRHYVETEYPHRLETVSLEPLTAEESLKMIEQVIGVGVLPAETESLIVQKSEGNPLFIQELLRSLIDDGSLVRETAVVDGQPVLAWRATKRVTELSLPDSLQGLFTARLHGLSAAQQQVLQRAAVIGYGFWSDILEAIAPDPAHLRQHLTALQREQVIAERGRGPALGVEYTFRSKLMRDAVYDSLLSAQRSAIHLQIAEYLESHLSDDGIDAAQGIHYGALAYHYGQASRPEKELLYTLKTADRAREIYANAEAVQHYTRALALLDALAAERGDEEEPEALCRQRFQALMHRQEVYHLLAEHDKMRADSEALLPLARRLTSADDPSWLIDALLHQAGVADYECRQDIEKAVPLAREALELSRSIGDRGRELKSLTAMINQCLALNNLQWSDYAEEALQLARTTNDHNFEARILVGLGGIYAFSDEPERGMQYLEAAAALAMNEGLDDRLVQMSLLNLLGLEYERSGDYYRLLTEYQQERLHASREIGHRPMESQALQACGRIAGIYLGDYATGLDLLMESQSIRRGTPRSAYIMFHIAQIHIAQADHARAAEVISEIHQMGEPVLDRAVASLRLVEAMLSNAQGARAATKGDGANTRDYLARTLELCGDVSALASESRLVSQQYEMAACTLAASAHLGLSQVESGETVQARHLEAALDAAERAYDILQLFGFAQIVECVSEEVLLRYAQALAANSQYELANRVLRRAYDEMMRKHALIPADSHFRRTYLEQIPLHREIKAAYATRVGSILAEPSLWQMAEPVA